VAAEPNGVRRLETTVPEFMNDFCRTVSASLDSRDLAQSILGCIDLYRRLRDDPRASRVSRRTAAERAPCSLLEQVRDASNIAGD